MNTKKQIGNAVPPSIAKVLFGHIRRALEKADGVVSDGDDADCIVLDGDEPDKARPECIDLDGIESDGPEPECIVLE